MLSNNDIGCIAFVFCFFFNEIYNFWRFCLVYYSRFWWSENRPYWTQRKPFSEDMSSAYLHYSKAPQNMLMLRIHLRKRSARWAIYMNRKFTLKVLQYSDDMAVTSYKSWVLTQQVKTLQLVEYDCKSTVVKAWILLVDRSALLWKNTYFLADESSGPPWISRWWHLNSSI